MRAPSAAKVLLAAAFAVLAASPGDAQERSFGHATTIAMPRGHKLEGVLAGDADGDGRPDLWLAVARGGKSPGREFRVHRRRDGPVAFGPEPDEIVDVHPDAVGVAIADVHPDPGDEVVLLTRTGAFAIRRSQAGRARFPRLVRADVLWQLPHDRELLDWSAGVPDIDGDGLADLLLPQPDGYVVAFQRRDEGNVRFDPYTLTLPDPSASPEGRGSRRLRGRSRGREFRVRLGVGEKKGGDLLSVSESVPAPALRDWDADGDLDVVVQTTEDLLVWRQGAGGTFAAAPDVALPLPLEVDRRRLLDVSYAALTHDLDGDRRTDYVLVAGDRDASDPRAQIAVFQRGDGGDAALFGEKGRPSQLLVVAGLAAQPRLADVDGDGSQDLVIGAARLDLLDTITSGGGGSIDAELYVYANRGGRLSRQPVLTVPVSVPAKGLRRARREVAARFLGDLTGDGVSELLLRADPTRLTVSMVRRAGEGLTVVPRPLYETRVPEKAEMRFLDGPVGPEVAVFDDASVLHLRFGR